MTSKYENQKYKQGYAHVLGCDEVGRGCLAGPVVAAAVFLRPQVTSYKLKVTKLIEIRDSKLLTADKREELSAIIKQNAMWGIGAVDEKVIDKINIHHATLLAMRRAVEDLLQNVVQARGLPHSDKQAEGLHYSGKHFLFVDGKFTIPGIAIEQEAVVDGDNKILSVAAASIIAKVYRDNLMKDIHQKFPIYNFAQHKGYGTLFHRTMILQNGLSPIHRKSFCGHLI